MITVTLTRRCTSAPGNFQVTYISDCKKLNLSIGRYRPILGCGTCGGGLLTETQALIYRIPVGTCVHNTISSQQKATYLIR